VLSLEESYGRAFDTGVVVEHPPAERLIRLTGPQRVWFLQNTITADVEAAAPGEWIESCLLDEKGRVFAYFFVGIAEDEIWIADNPAYGARLADWFVSRRFRTKVEIEPIEVKRFTRIGGAVPSSGFTTDPARFGRSIGELAACDEFDDALVADAPFELYELLRVEAGYGRFGVDFDERTLPQEAGLARTLSVEKGCYVGQETVARIHFRGHINKVLRTLRSEMPLEIGAELTLDGENIGRITSAVVSPRLGPVGIGMVRVEPPEGPIDGGVTLGPLPEGTKVKAS
jgi:folate-binding protein YgfZ